MSTAILEASWSNVHSNPPTQALSAAKFATYSCSTAPPLESQANHMSRIHLLACIRRKVESANTTIHNTSVTQRASYQAYISASVNCDGSRVAADRAGLEGWPQLLERMVRYCLRCRFHAWIAMHANQHDRAPPAHAAKATLTPKLAELIVVEFPMLCNRFCPFAQRTWITLEAQQTPYVSDALL